MRVVSPSPWGEGVRAAPQGEGEKELQSEGRFPLSVGRGGEGRAQGEGEKELQSEGRFPLSVGEGVRAAPKERGRRNCRVRARPRLPSRRAILSSVLFFVVKNSLRRDIHGITPCLYTIASAGK